MQTGFELRFPTAQNAVDLVPQWTSLFPASAGVSAGTMNLFNDVRITWALEKFGQDLAGKKVLELGPLEGGHTTMLTQRGATVDAIEASQIAYVKCLIVKEILQIKNARFHLGDCIQWAEKAPQRYDLVVACGVLYHMEDPMRLLKALAGLTDNLYLWTVYVDDPKLKPTKVENLGDLPVRMYGVPYGPKDVGFTGGAPAMAHWTQKADILGALSWLGFDHIEVAHDRPEWESGSPATYSVYARRATPATTKF
jgi:hypothetical protein